MRMAVVRLDELFKAFGKMLYFYFDGHDLYNFNLMIFYFTKFN